MIYISLALSLNGGEPLFLYILSRLVRELIHNKGAGNKRGGRGEDKTVGNRDIRSVEERGMGRGTRSIQDGQHRDFQEGKQGI